jgi:hypothetical protein
MIGSKIALPSCSSSNGDFWLMAYLNGRLLLVVSSKYNKEKRLVFFEGSIKDNGAAFLVNR